MTIWSTRIACWIPKDTNTPSEYVILTAFSLQQWLHEHASMVRYTYISCIVKLNLIHIPCNSLIIKYLVQKNSTINNKWSFVSYVPSTCFDLCNVIIKEVYRKAYKYSKFSQGCLRLS